MTNSPLNSQTLLEAYRLGFFPMPEPETNEILWYHPDPRAVIPLNNFHASKSLLRTIKRQSFSVTFDHCFKDIMLGCADRDDTWINADFLNMYQELHRIGFAHSVEVWQNDQLAGGLYGVALGGAFFAESKFMKVRDASKIALFHLVQHMKSLGYVLLEVQFLTKHLTSLGAIQISAEQYMAQLNQALTLNPKSWVSVKTKLD